MILYGMWCEERYCHGNTTAQTLDQYLHPLGLINFRIMMGMTVYLSIHEPRAVCMLGLIYSFPASAL